MKNISINASPTTLGSDGPPRSTRPVTPIRGMAGSASAVIVNWVIGASIEPLNGFSLEFGL